MTECCQKVFSWLVLNFLIFPRANLKNDANGKHVRLVSLDSSREAGKISQLEEIFSGALAVI